MEHKFKRMRGFTYIVLSQCEHCDIVRQGTKGHYVYMQGNNNSTLAPPCISNEPKK